MPCAKNSILATLALTLALTGCSSDKESDQPDPPASPSQSSQAEPSVKTLSPVAVTKAMGSLSSLTLQASFGSNDTVLQASLSSDSRCVGEVSGASLGGGSMNFRMDKNKIVVQGDSRFWASLDPAKGKRFASVVGSRWVLVNRAQFGSYLPYCSFNTLLAPFLAPRFESDFTVVGKEKINNVMATIATDASGKTTVWISDKDDRMVKLERNDVVLTFSDFNGSVKPGLPSPENILRLSDLQTS